MPADGFARRNTCAAPVESKTTSGCSIGGRHDETRDLPGELVFSASRAFLPACFSPGKRGSRKSSRSTVAVPCSISPFTRNALPGRPTANYPLSQPRRSRADPVRRQRRGV
jgi:hypothetical protein